jgi:hypothetical protein
MEHKEVCEICGKPIIYGLPHVGHSPPFRMSERKRMPVRPTLHCPVKGCAFSARMQSTIKGHLKTKHGMGLRGTPPASPNHHYPTDSQPDPVAELEKQMGSLTLPPKGGKRKTHRRCKRKSRKTQRK